MSFKAGETYFWADHPDAFSYWPKRKAPYKVVLESETKKVMTFSVVDSGERFLVSTWPYQHKGVFRGPWKTGKEAQQYLEGPMIRFDHDGRTL